MTTILNSQTGHWVKGHSFTCVLFWAQTPDNNVSSSH